MKHDLITGSASANAVDWLATQPKDFKASSVQLVEGAKLTCEPGELRHWLGAALRKGYIARHPDPADGRRSLWALGTGPTDVARNAPADASPMVQRVVQAAATTPPTTATLPPIPTLTKAKAREALDPETPSLAHTSAAPAGIGETTINDLDFFAGQTADGCLVIFDKGRGARFSPEQSRAIARACAGL